MSTFGLDPDQDEVELMPLHEVALELENLLISRATGGTESESRFRALRARLTSNLPAEVLPEFVRTCRSLGQFWAYAKKWPTYGERRQAIWSGFASLHDAFERDATTPDVGPVAGDTESPPDTKNIRPQVTNGQRRVLDELRRIYLETADWPTHAYLEQELEEQGIDVDAELRTIPDLTYFPDNRRLGGGVFFQDHDKVALMLRGLVACSDAQREIMMFIATIKWAVEARRSVRHQPHEVVLQTWRAADAIRAMREASGGQDPDAWEAKLVLEIMRTEPADVPKWSGQPDAFPDWQLDIPSGIKRFKDVESIDDYLKETQPKSAYKVIATPGLPIWPEVGPSATTLRSSTDHHPIFGRLVRRAKTFDCFALLPLSEPFKTIYAQGVKPIAEELGMTCGHAAEIFGPGHIMRDIVSSITFAEVIVAELTNRNPNVFYELGIAHEQGKQVVLLTQRMEDVPFDIREMRVVVYEWAEATPDPTLLKKHLRPHLQEALRSAREIVGRPEPGY